MKEEEAGRDEPTGKTMLTSVCMLISALRVQAAQHKAPQESQLCTRHRKLVWQSLHHFIHPRGSVVIELVE